MQAFTFKYQNNKGGGYFLLGFLGAPFATLTLSFLLLEYVSWIFWITIPLMIGLIIYFMRKFIKISQGKDTIEVDDLGFTSHDYGRILYSDIHSIPPYGPLQAAPPSMRIKLHNGKKIAWNFNPKSPKGMEDIEAFSAFREAFLEQLKHWEQTTGSVQAAEPVVENTVVEQLEKHKKRDFSYKYVTIPLGFAVAVLGFVRTCGDDFIRERNAKQLAGLRNMAYNMEDDYTNNLQEARRVAATYTRKFGTVFLWTNDPESTLTFIPDIQKDPYLPEINVIGIRRAEDNELLEKFIQHPDSATYNLVLANPSMDFFTALQPSLLGEQDSTAAVAYFALYNPHESLPSRGGYATDTAFHPIEYTTSINVPREGPLTKDVLHNMDFASVRAIIQQYEGTYFYLAVKEMDGISPERFEELLELIRTDFKTNGIATENLQSRNFNTEPPN